MNVDFLFQRYPNVSIWKTRSSALKQSNDRSKTEIKLKIQNNRNITCIEGKDNIGDLIIHPT